MKKSNITRVSLQQIEEMNSKGAVYYNPDAPAGESLGRDFWANAQVVEPKSPMPVLLKVDPDVLAFFKEGGRGHLTRMQNVLKAYVNAHRQQ